MEMYEQFINEFSVNLENAVHKKQFSDLIFLCIGTDRITGDSFGPLVGYKLKELYRKETHVHVIGDLQKPVVANNINEIIKEIEENFDNPLIISIDSAVSNKNNVGKVFITEGSMNIGNGLDKKIAEVGDISIKGVVSKNLGNPKYNFILLQNTPLYLVMNMAESTAKGIYDVIDV